MRTINFLCADEKSTDLAEFSQRIFDALRAVDRTERNSSNYLDETYFVGKIDEARVTVAWSDETGFDDLPYWVCFEAEGGDEMQTRTESFIRRSLPVAGMTVAKIENFGKKTVYKTPY